MKNYNNDAKNEQRNYICKYRGKTAKVAVFLPSRECLDIKSSLENNVINKDTFLIIVEKDKEIVQNYILPYLNENGFKYHIHNDELYKIDLNCIVEKHGKIDFANFDICGQIEYNISNWLLNLKGNEFSENCHVFWTICTIRKSNIKDKIGGYLDLLYNEDEQMFNNNIETITKDLFNYDLFYLYDKWIKDEGTDIFNENERINHAKYTNRSFYTALLGASHRNFHLNLNSCRPYSNGPTLMMVVELEILGERENPSYASKCLLTHLEEMGYNQKTKKEGKEMKTKNPIMVEAGRKAAAKRKENKQWEEAYSRFVKEFGMDYKDQYVKDMYSELKKSENFIKMREKYSSIILNAKTENKPSKIEDSSKFVSNKKMIKNPKMVKAGYKAWETRRANKSKVN